MGEPPLSSSVNSGANLLEYLDTTSRTELNCANERLCKGKSGSTFPGFPALRKGIALSKPLAIHLCNAHRLRPRLKGRSGNRRAGCGAQGCWLRTHLIVRRPPVDAGIVPSFTGSLIISAKATCLWS